MRSTVDQDDWRNGILRGVQNDGDEPSEKLEELSKAIRSTTKMIMDVAGLSDLHWTPFNAKLIYKNEDASQTSPTILLAAPAYQAFVHLRCCSEKVLKYAGPHVSKESAADFMSLPSSLNFDDAATAVKIARRRPALDAHLLRVANLCQDRLELEKHMVPWGGEGGPWSSRYDAVVFRGEEVIAMPPRADVRPRCCSGKDKCPDEGKPDVMFHVEFVPRGGMAFNFDDNGVKPVTPWMVATHPAVLPCLIPDQDERIEHQTRRHEETTPYLQRLQANFRFH